MPRKATAKITKLEPVKASRWPIDTRHLDEVHARYALDLLDAVQAAQGAVLAPDIKTAASAAYAHQQADRWREAEAAALLLDDTKTAVQASCRVERCVRQHGVLINDLALRGRDRGSARSQRVAAAVEVTSEHDEWADL